MYLRNRVRQFLSDSERLLHDDNGVALSKARVLKEFYGVREYIIGNARPDEIAAIRLPHDYRYVLTILACIDAGITYVPLKTEWPDARVNQIKGISGFTHMIDEGIYSDSVKNSAGSRQSEYFPVETKSPCYVLFTSGSTGEPKGVVIARRSLELLSQWMGKYFDKIGREDKILLMADFTFDQSLTDICLLLEKNCELYVSKFAGNYFKLGDEISNFKITGIATVSNNVNALLMEGFFERFDLQSLRHLMLGGSRYLPATYRNILEKLPRAVSYNMYGPTETTVYSHVHRVTGIENEDIIDANVSVGPPLPDIDCVLVDSNFKKISAAMTRGQLLLGGEKLMLGYIGGPEKNRDCFAELNGKKYYKSGDLGFFDNNGKYYIVGRNDDTIKRRGMRINLLDIDAYIQKMKGVQDCITVALPDAEHDNILICYAVAEKGLSAKDLKSKMAGVLVDHQIPDYVELIDKLPATPNGKIDKRLLENMFKEKRR